MNKDADIVNSHQHPHFEIRVLDEWPERKRQRTEINLMFDRQMERAKLEDLRRALWREKQVCIAPLYELLTFQEMEFVVFLAKVYHKLKTIFS